MCSISSSRSDLVHNVTEKPPLSKRPASERRAKSSGVTSPVSSLDGDPGPSQGTISGKREPHLPVEHRAQLPDNSSSKKADRDSGFCSMGSPDVQHKGSVSSEVKECRTVEHTRETWGKRI